MFARKVRHEEHMVPRCSPKRKSPPSMAKRSHSSVSTLLLRTNSSMRIDTALPKWLAADCPSDILPKILAYAGGPDLWQLLADTHPQWKQIIQNDATWKVFCEELYKWKPGQDHGHPPKGSHTWKQYYELNPCVPIDCPSIQHALRRAYSTKRNSSAPQAQDRSINIWLRPGTYHLYESITVNAAPLVEINIRTMSLPHATFYHAPRRENAHSTTTSTPPTLRQRLSCRNNQHIAQDNSSVEEIAWETTPPQRHATIVLRTHRSNEPVAWVQRGTLRLSNVELQHQCAGIDIWNGNAAVHIQTSLASDPPTAYLDRVRVTSRSGRGLVNIDGGTAHLTHCLVQDCAATGIYVGGTSRAVVQYTDVIHNGIGCRRGIARGHSGIYIEQGHAHIVQCNVSGNTLSGISSISPENAILELEDCDLCGNGTFQLEMPPPGTPARNRSVTINNQLSVRGTGTMRSGLWTPDNEACE